MPDINFNDTYDELSNLAPKAVSREEFIPMVEKAVKEQYGDIICTEEEAKAKGLIDYNFCYMELPKTEADIEYSINGNLYEIDSLIGTLKWSKGLEYKLAINTNFKRYVLIILFLSEDARKYRLHYYDEKETKFIKEHTDESKAPKYAPATWTDAPILNPLTKD